MTIGKNTYLNIGKVAYIDHFTNKNEGESSDFFEYLVSERKLRFFVKIKEGENFNHRNTGSISRIKI
jgi:hypothetical protein